jgi:hypothetical protein
MNPLICPKCKRVVGKLVPLNDNATGLKLCVRCKKHERKKKL